MKHKIQRKGGTQEHTIRLQLKPLADRSHAIIVRSGLLQQLPAIIAQKWQAGTAFVITDTNVGRLYGRRFLTKLLEQGVTAELLDFPPGEQSKSIRLVQALYSQLLRHGVHRDSLIVALGGGVVGDVAGYVAATVLRGVKYIQVPTTLLAQVDSSVGGKVGIDHPLGKNLIGAFHEPAEVFIDPSVLQTLPVEEFRNGIAEIVKIAAALDDELFEHLSRNAQRITRDNQRLITEIIARSISLKASVVEKDEHETGLRMVLNLGHTLGHALEAASNYTIKHGIAVSVGLAAESKIALNMGLLGQREYSRLIKLLSSLKLSTKFPPIKDRRKFFSALSTDKKSSDGGTRFVLLKTIGHSVVGVDVPTPFIREVIGQPT